MNLEKKKSLRQKRIWRVRKKVVGTPERPRLCVAFTNAHIHAQVIDDTSGTTKAAVSTVSKDLRDDKLSSNVDGAVRLGKSIGEKAKAQGITKVVFDRHGRRYHGRVKAFAEAAREAGLEF